MKKRYMDFVPAKTARAGKAKREEAIKKPVAEPKVTQVDEFEISEIMKVREEKPRAGVSVGRKKEPKYGVIEDFRPKFVNTEVKKRPLSRAKELKEEVTALKAKKLLEKKPAKMISREEPLEKEKAKEADKGTLSVPKARFVNTEKVEKRPLSKNVYTKKIVAPEEKASEPVTIIGDTEKDSKLGLVVTILITIILGAAAGTVAFLLLPK